MTQTAPPDASIAKAGAPLPRGLPHHQTLQLV
jgi:hypothetical protein